MCASHLHRIAALRHRLCEAEAQEAEKVIPEIHNRVANALEGFFPSIAS
jgi:hypothetical protein